LTLYVSLSFVNYKIKVNYKQQGQNNFLHILNSTNIMLIANFKNNHLNIYYFIGSRDWLLSLYYLLSIRNKCKNFSCWIA